jgi:hypothetical protein
MKRDALKIRYGVPKYSRAWSALLALGFGLPWLTQHLDPAAPGPISTLVLLFLAVGVSVFVAGMIAERRDWERQQEKSDENHSDHMA